MNGLDKKYGDKMKFEIVHWQGEGNPERIVKYELDKHGMVIADAAGEKVWAESGHEQTSEQVENAIRKALGL